jgi:hypothetical protein
MMDDQFLKSTGVKDEDDAMREALKSALQQRQNKVYKGVEMGTERKGVRTEWSNLIRDESKGYIDRKFDAGRSDTAHCDAIRRIAESLSGRFGEILKAKVLRDGNGVSALPIAWLQRSNHKGAGAT